MFRAYPDYDAVEEHYYEMHAEEYECTCNMCGGGEDYYGEMGYY